MNLPNRATAQSTEDIMDKVLEILESLGHDAIIDNLKDYLQTAVEIELSTIPVYLYTYYSINRTGNHGLNTAQQLDGYGIYANKAAGIIMSVAVEEMLHMSLSSNILYALGGDPQLYLKSPGPFPTNLPHHFPKGPDGTDLAIPLSGFSYEQMWAFLEIEYPKPYGDIAYSLNGTKLEVQWTTIGQFYKFIGKIINLPLLTDADFQKGGQSYQVQDYNYSPNNIDTIYPTAAFGPWGLPQAQANGGGVTPTSPSAAAVAAYPNQPDSHKGATELMTIASKQDALTAIGTICDQGEGFDPATGNPEYDDPSHLEESHYYKFLTLQAQLEEYAQHYQQEKLPPQPVPPAPIDPAFSVQELLSRVLLYNFPDNPMTRVPSSGAKDPLVLYYSDISGTPDFIAEIQALSDLCNGVYQYMFILSESIFKVPDPDQRLFFNNAMHRSMIWILDKLIQLMRSVPFEYNGTQYQLAPTFENYDLGDRKDAFANLVKLIAPAKSGLTNIPGFESNYLDSIEGQIEKLPDIAPLWS